MSTLKSPAAPVGIFDSGVGGLTVAREIMRQLPNESLIYFGDTARVPYGNKSKVTVIRYSRQIVRFLRSKGVKAIVIACNTASSLALDTLREELDIPIIGVVEPGAKAAIATGSRHIGVIGTEATVRSNMYGKIIHGIDPDVTVTEKACPLFVPLVEEGFAKHHVTEEIADYYLHSLLEEGIDSLILGCTHYPLLRSVIGGYLGDKVTLINPAYETAVELKRLLRENGLANDGGQESAGHSFYVSDAADKFMQFANLLLPCDIDSTAQVNIDF